MRSGSLGETACDAFNVGRLACSGIDVDQGAVQPDGAFGDGKHSRHRGQETLDDRCGLSTQAALGRATHSGIREECSPSRKNLFIRGLRVRVCADDTRNPAVQKTAHGDLFAGGFGVDIDEDDGRFLPDPTDFSVDGDKRILEGGLGEGPALDIDHSDFALAGFEHDRSESGSARRVVDRTQQARFSW